MHAALEDGGPNAKVKTGHLCGAQFDGQSGRALCWNEAPTTPVVRRYFS